MYKQTADSHPNHGSSGFNPEIGQTASDLLIRRVWPPLDRTGQKSRWFRKKPSVSPSRRFRIPIAIPSPELMHF